MKKQYLWERCFLILILFDRASLVVANFNDLIFQAFVDCLTTVHFPGKSPEDDPGLFS